MKNPYTFDQAWNYAEQTGLTSRTRLRRDELNVLCQIMHNKKHYIEVGVYDGLSSFVISACTCIEYIRLIDINENEYVDRLIQQLGVGVFPSWKDFRSVETFYAPDTNNTSWFLLDAEHEYEPTKEAYEWACKIMPMATIVLHDVEMPGPKQLFEEIGGVKIVSSEKEYISPDGKVLPPLGYGILKR